MFLNIENHINYNNIYYRKLNMSKLNIDQKTVKELFSGKKQIF